MYKIYMKKSGMLKRYAHTTCLIMRLTTVILIASLMQVSAASLAQRLTLNKKKASLENIFKEIHQQTGYDFLYNRALLNSKKPVDINVSNEPLETVLQRCLNGQQLKFSIEEKMIVVTPVEKSIVQALIDKFLDIDVHGRILDDRAENLKGATVTIKGTDRTVRTDANGEFFLKNVDSKAIIVISYAGYAIREMRVQQQMGAIQLRLDFPVHGTVLGEDGIPLSGATITLQDTRTSRISNSKGEFIINASEGGILTVSYLGFESKQFTATREHSTSLFVMLQKSTNTLDEVQVIAYGTTTKRLSTGNVTTIRAEDLTKSASPNVMQALQGMVPGLTITQLGANATSSFNINLRGFRSIPTTATTTSNLDAINTPLIVVDGFPLSTGVSTANNNGLLQNNLGPSSGQSAIFNINPNDIESISVLKDADATALYGSMGANGVILITTKKPKNGKLTVDAKVGTGFTQQGGYLPLLNTEQYLAMRKEAFANDKATPKMSNAYDLLAWDQNRYTDWQKELLGNRPSVDANVSISGGLGGTSFRLSFGYFKDLAGYQGAPAALVKDYNENRITGNLTTSSQSLNGKFKLSTSIGYTPTKSNLPSGGLESLIYLAPNAPALFTPSGQINWDEWRVAGDLIGNTVGAMMNPYKSDTKDLRLGVNISYEMIPGLILNLKGSYNNSIVQQVIVGKSQASSDPLLPVVRETAFGINNATSSSIEPSLNYTKKIGRHSLSFLAAGNYNENNQNDEALFGSGWLSDELQTALVGATSIQGRNNYRYTKIVSVFGAINYVYDSRYVLNLNGRRDGSSDFGPGNKFGNFGSIGGAWILTKEKWLQRLTKTGLFSYAKIRGSLGITGTPVGSPYTYLSTYTNMYGMSYQDAPTYYITRPANPNVQWSQTNKKELGVELGFFNDRLLISGSTYRDNTTHQITESPLAATTGFTSTIFNMPGEVQNTGMEGTINYRSDPAKKVIWSFGFNIARNRNKLISFPNLDQSVYAKIYAVGESLNRIYLYHSPGINPLTGTYPFPTATSSYIANVEPWGGGLQAQISYKGFTISGNFSYARQKGYQGLKLSGTPGSLEGGSGNQVVGVLERWQKPGDLSVIPKFTTGSSSFDGYNYDNFYGDASYVALKNATFSYSPDKNLLRSLRISSLSVFVNADNIFTISNYKGSNPERPSSTVEMIRRRFSIGLNGSF